MISPRYLKCLTLLIFPYFVSNFCISDFVHMNSVFSNDMCNPTLFAHDSSVSICLTAFSVESVSMTMSSAKARQGISSVFFPCLFLLVSKILILSVLFPIL